MPNAYIGYVFLFFYGLERRVFLDLISTPEHSDVAVIEAEVRRLLGLYGGNGSFRSYASSFLDVLATLRNVGEGSTEAPVESVRSFELPLQIRVGVSKVVSAGRPLPGDWALAWALSDFESPTRTPAQRCPVEFRELFLRRYRERHGEGVAVSPSKRKIEFSYKPASATFGGAIDLSLDLFDATNLIGPKRILHGLVGECCDALDGYSRWLGRNPNGRDSLAALAYLPPDLLETNAPPSFRELKQRIEQRVGEAQAGVFEAGDAIGIWLPKDGTRQSAKEAVEMVEVLGKAGFGIEPDPRFGGVRVSRADKVTIFRLSSQAGSSPSPEYRAAAMLLQLAAMVAAADGEVAPQEIVQIKAHLGEALQLAPAEQERLAAHLMWLDAQPPAMAGLKKRVEVLSDDQRANIGQFLVRVALADGRIDPDEVKSLTRIYRLLGLDPGRVHGAIHELGYASPARGPVPVMRPGSGEAEYAIPPRAGDESGKQSRGPVVIDMETVRDKLQESAEVSALLASIFTEEPELPTLPETTEQTGAKLAGLDGPHSGFLRRLGEKQVWPRDEFEHVAEELGLLCDGAIERLNEVALDTCGEPVVNGENPIEVDERVYEELVR